MSVVKKTITVQTPDGSEVEELVGEGDYLKMIRHYQVQYLKRVGGGNVRSFAALEDRATYELGPAAEQPPVVQPPQSDVSMAWINSESQPVTKHSDYGGSHLQSLAEFLNQPPSNRAPIDQTMFNIWKEQVSQQELLKYFEPVSGGDACRTMSIVLSAAFFYPIRIIGENEEGYHGRMDQCISDFLGYFAPEFKLCRNSSQDSSSYPLKRPDFSATIPNKGCFFRGEEKKLGSYEDPQVELYSKLQGTWPFPGLPFVLGYFSAGTAVTFCAVSKDKAEILPGLVLELNNPQARIQCWNIVRNVSRVIKFMAVTTSSMSPYDMQDLEKEHSMATDWTRTISFSGGHVRMF